MVTMFCCRSSYFFGSTTSLFQSFVSILAARSGACIFLFNSTVSLLQRALGTNKQSPLTSWRSYIATSKRCSTETTRRKETVSTTTLLFLPNLDLLTSPPHQNTSNWEAGLMHTIFRNANRRGVNDENGIATIVVFGCRVSILQHIPHLFQIDLRLTADVEVAHSLALLRGTLSEWTSSALRNDWMSPRRKAGRRHPAPFPSPSSSSPTTTTAAAASRRRSSGPSSFERRRPESSNVGVGVPASLRRMPRGAIMHEAA
jgi:hypothetical protein